MMADGFAFKTRGKNISVFAPGQEHPTRLKTLAKKYGEQYTEMGIRERLKTNIVAPKMQPAKPTGTRANLLIDIQAKIAEGKGIGYEKWARVFNLQQAAKTLIFLKENGIDSYEDLVGKAALAFDDFHALSDKIKSAEKRMDEIAELQKQIGIYGRTREVYKAYKASGWDKKYYADHQEQIGLHRAAKKYFNGLGLTRLPKISELKQEYATLLAGKKKDYTEYRTVKENMTRLLTARENASRILDIRPGTQKQDRETPRKPRQR